MKKHKIFLTLFLISILFVCANVNASTETTLSYSSDVISNLSTYSTLIDNIKEYASTHTIRGFSYINYNLDNNDTILSFYFPPNSNYVEVSYLKENVSGKTYKNRITGDGTSTSNVILMVMEPSMTFAFNYDASYNITSVNALASPFTSSVGLLDNGVIYLNYYFDATYGSNCVKNIQNDLSLLDLDLVVNDNVYTNNETFSLLELSNDLKAPPEPQYTYTTEILDNGNVRLDFLFTNYTDTSSLYGFSISNEISGEYYGETNRFSYIFPNTIPLGTSYSIELPYDTFIYVTLARYNPVEGSDTLYLREIIYTDSIDINNIVFTDPVERYFNITSQTQFQLTGIFKNTKDTDICHYQFSTDIVTHPVSCTDTLNLSLNYNGFVTIYIYDMWGETQYSRKINFLGNSNPEIPYIKYNITQQQIYNIVNWSIENSDYDNTMEYRYSTDNGTTFTEWTPVGTTTSYKINVFSNSSVIIMLSNADQSVYYDTKTIYVVLDFTKVDLTNNSTMNLVEQFENLFSVNGNILTEINNIWSLIKGSKLYLVIFISFVGSIISGIIYLIRRK